MARSLDELRALADANGMEAVAEVVQKRSVPEAATLLGEGKVAEARLVCQNLDARAAIFDGELTGSQIRNLSSALQVEVLDRTMLILEIFRARATTNEGKLQTEPGHPAVSAAPAAGPGREPEPPGRRRWRRRRCPPRRR